MPTFNASYRHRRGTEAQRDAATLINANEISRTTDREEVFIGRKLIVGKGNSQIAPTAAGNSTMDWPCRYRDHYGRVAPVEAGAPYTFIVILPTTPAPRGGDEGTIFLVLPATTQHVTIEIRNATSGGTLLLSLASSAAASKWRFTFNYLDSGAWELTGADELLLS